MSTLGGSIVSVLLAKNAKSLLPIANAETQVTSAKTPKSYDLTPMEILSCAQSLNLFKDTIYTPKDKKKMS